MKNLTKLLAFTVVVLGLYSSSFAQDPFATAIASGTIASGSAGGSTLTKDQDLQFGNISTTGIAGTVSQPASTALATYSNVTGSGALAAKFTLTTGAPNTAYPVSIANWPTVVTNTTGTGSETMALSSAVTNLSGGSITVAAGSAIIYIGASLTVGATEVAGIYESSPFTVTIDLP